MREDYPWVSFLMEPLQGLSVPCDFQAMVDRWSDANTLEDLPGKMRGEEGARLPPAHLDHGPDGVSKDLEALGIFYRMQGERINIPDVYRVGYGLGRRGGVRAVR
jgi:hypothetical protein